MNSKNGKSKRSPKSRINVLVGSRLRELRKEKGLKQDEFGGLFGLSQNDITLIENGYKNISYGALVEIANKYTLSTDYFLKENAVKGNNPDIQFICDYLGLSEKAVNKLRSITHNPTHIQLKTKPLLESLICYGHISDIAYYAAIYLEQKIKDIELHKEISDLIKNSKYNETDFEYKDNIFYSKVYRVLDIMEYESDIDNSNLMKVISEKRQQLFDCEDKQDLEMFKAQKSLSEFFNNIDYTCKQEVAKNEKK